MSKSDQEAFRDALLPKGGCIEFVFPRDNPAALRFAKFARLVNELTMADSEIRSIYKRWLRCMQGEGIEIKSMKDLENLISSAPKLAAQNETQESLNEWQLSIARTDADCRESDFDKRANRIRELESIVLKAEVVPTQG